MILVLMGVQWSKSAERSTTTVRPTCPCTISVAPDGCIAPTTLILGAAATGAGGQTNRSILISPCPVDCSVPEFGCRVTVHRYQPDAPNFRFFSFAPMPTWKAGPV